MRPMPAFRYCDCSPIVAWKLLRPGRSRGSKKSPSRSRLGSSSLSDPIVPAIEEQPLEVVGRGVVGRGGQDLAVGVEEPQAVAAEGRGGG